MKETATALLSDFVPDWSAELKWHRLTLPGTDIFRIARISRQSTAGPGVIRRSALGMLATSALLAAASSGCGHTQHPVTIAPATEGWRIDVDELGVSWRFAADPHAIVGVGTRPDQSGIDVVRLSPTSGEVLWRTDANAIANSYTQAWVFGDTIVAQAGNRLLGLDSSNGGVIWFVDLPDTGTIAQVDVLAGSLVVTLTNQTIEVITVRNGNRTTTRLPEANEPMAFARFSGSIFVAVSMYQTGEVAFGRVQGGDFSADWSTPLTGTVQQMHIDGSVVTLVTASSELPAFNRSTGEPETSSAYITHTNFIYGAHYLSWTSRAGRFLHFQDFSSTEFGAGEPSWTTSTTIVSAPAILTAYPANDLLLVTTSQPSFLLFREDGTLVWTATLSTDPTESCTLVGTDGMHVIRQCTGFAESYLRAHPTESGR